MVTGAIIGSVSQLKHALGILFLFFLVFAILGVGFFKGSLKHRCFYGTTPDSPPYMYRNMSLKDFRAEWTSAFGDFRVSPGTRALEILSPTLDRLNLSASVFFVDPEWSESRQALQRSVLSTVENQAYADNLWRLALPACGHQGFLSCDESYLPPLCTDPVDAKGRISLGGYQCPPGDDGSLTVCRASSPFFEVPNNNPPLFLGWCARGRSLKRAVGRFCFFLNVGGFRAGSTLTTSAQLSSLSSRC